MFGGFKPQEKCFLYGRLCPRTKEPALVYIVHITMASFPWFFSTDSGYILTLHEQEGSTEILRFIQ